MQKNQKKTVCNDGELATGNSKNEDRIIYEGMLKEDASSSKKINDLIEKSVAVFIPVGGALGLFFVFYSIVEQNYYWILGVVILFFVMLFRFVKTQELKRVESLQRFALQNGMEFNKDPTNFFFVDRDKIELFRMGVLPTNMLEKKTDEYDLYVFDHTYQVRRGNGRESIYTQTVCLFRKKSRSLPGFSLKPESVFHKFASVFGYQDIDFESNPQFSKRYLLRGKDEDAIRDVFKSDNLQYFEKMLGYYVEASGADLIVYKHNKEVKSKNYGDFIQVATEINNMFN